LLSGRRGFVIKMQKIHNYLCRLIITVVLLLFLIFRKRMLDFFQLILKMFEKAKTKCNYPLYRETSI